MGFESTHLYQDNCIRRATLSCLKNGTWIFLVNERYEVIDGGSDGNKSSDQIEGNFWLILNFEDDGL